MKKRILVIAAVVAVLLAGVFLFLSDGLSQGKSLVINPVDLSALPDGNYTGTYDYKRWANTLVVHVKDHQITGIDIEKDVQGAGITNCSAEVFKRVIAAQSTQVDAVSGATVTSKAYLKAIEDALD